MDETIIYKTLKKEYNGLELVDKKITAKILGISVVTLDRLRKNGCGIEYKIIGNKILYPLYAIAIYISQTQKVFGLSKTQQY